MSDELDTIDDKPVTTCYACHKNIDIDPNSKIKRSEECPYCYASLKCCRMCQFYAPGQYNECRESNAERLLEKEKANFCDYFVLYSCNIDPEEVVQEQWSNANALFKD